MNRAMTACAALVCLPGLLLSGCGGAPETGAGRSSNMAPLAAEVEGFTQARPGTPVRLPEDMGAHRDYRFEWWYLTANLRSADGQRFGIQWTLFRIGLKPRPAASEPDIGWDSDELWLAHAALSRPGTHYFASKSARGGSGQAGVNPEPFSSWIDQWQFGAGSGGRYELAVEAPAFAYRLALQPVLPAVFHGDQGFSAKSASGGGSMYFSYPALQIEGQLQLGDERFEVRGLGWFDREWSSQYLQPGQQGWDWLALHLEDDRRLMLFRMRGAGHFIAGTLIEADGRARPLSPDEFRLSPVEYRHTGRARLPVKWHLAIPGAAIELEIESWPGEYWNPGRFTYWEGPVEVRGSHQGEGYLEMTGYE